MNDLFHSFAAPEEACSKKELRPHQVRAIQMIRQSLAQGNRRVVCQMPTGAGKTLTAAKIIEGARSKGKGVIFTAPAVSLIDQTVRAFEAEGIRDIGVMQASHARTNSLAQVQVATVQTLARRDIPQAALVIVDECHLKADVIDALMADRPDVFFIGLSATPWRQGMGRVWQDLVIPTTIGELIETGFLSQFVAYAPDVPDLSGVRIKAGEYVESALERVMGEAKLMGSVVQTWLAKGGNRPTLCFGVNCPHAANLAAEFEGHGVASAYVDADTDIIERERINRKFRAGEIRVICSVRTMTTGVDLPVSCIIDAAPTTSEMLHIQKLGRGLRVNPGTEDCLILDHAGNCLRLGLPTDIAHDALDDSKPGKKRKPLPKAEKLPKECPKCGTLQVGRVCLSCGHERIPQAGVEVKDGDLVAVGRKAKPASKADKQRFYSMALALAEMRGKPDSFAAGMFKGFFGVWPRGLERRLVSPDQGFLNYDRSRRIAYAKRIEAQRGAQ